MPKAIILLLFIGYCLNASGQVAKSSLQTYITLEREGKTTERAAKHVREIAICVTDTCRSKTQSTNFVYEYDEHGNITKEISLHSTKEFTNNYNGSDLGSVYVVRKSKKARDRRDTARYMYKGSQLQRSIEPTDSPAEYIVTDFTYNEAGLLKEQKRYFQTSYLPEVLRPQVVRQYFYTKDSTYTLSRSLSGDTGITFIHVAYKNKQGKLTLEKYGHLKDQRTIYIMRNSFSYDAKGNLSQVISRGYHFDTGASMTGPDISRYKNKYDSQGNLRSIEEFFSIGKDRCLRHSFYFFDKQGKVTRIVTDCETWVYLYK